MDAAGPAEILVSRTVRDLVAGSDVALEDRGTHSLKGVDQWQLFAVTSRQLDLTLTLKSRVSGRTGCRPSR